MRKYSESWKSVIDSVRYGESWSGNERNCFYLNNNGQRFIDISYLSGLDFDDDGRGIGITDWDADGDLDLIYRNRSAPRIRIINNKFKESPNSILLKLQGVTCNRDAIGSRVELISGDRKIMRSVKAGDMFLSQSTKWLHFGLSSKEYPEKIIVYWNGGGKEEFSGFNSNGRYTLVEGKGVATHAEQLKPDRNVKEVELKVKKQIFSNHVFLPVKVPFPVISYRGPDARTKPVDLYGGPLILNLWESKNNVSVDELSYLKKEGVNFRKYGINCLSLSVDNIENAGNAYEVIEEIDYKNKWGFIDKGSMERIERWLNKLFDRHDDITFPLSFLIDSTGKCTAIFKGSIKGLAPVDLIDHINMNPLDRWHFAPPLKGSWFTFPPDEKYVRSVVVD